VSAVKTLKAADRIGADQVMAIRHALVAVSSRVTGRQNGAARASLTLSRSRCENYNKVLLRESLPHSVTNLMRLPDEHNGPQPAEDEADPDIVAEEGKCLAGIHEQDERAQSEIHQAD